MTRTSTNRSGRGRGRQGRSPGLRSQMRTFWCFLSSKTPTSINNGQIEKKLYSMEANGLGFTQHVFLYTNIAY